MSDYIMAFQQMIDSVGTPSDSNFTDVFLFMDDDISSNLTSFYAFGILERTTILISQEISPSFIDENIKDYKKLNQQLFLIRIKFLIEKQT